MKKKTKNQEIIVRPHLLPVVFYLNKIVGKKGKGSP